MAGEGIGGPVAVVGGGPSGALVAGWSAAAGRAVRVVEVSERAGSAALERIETALGSDGLVDPHDVPAAMARIEAVVGLPAVVGFGLVVEAGDGDLVDTLARLDQLAPVIDAAAVVATTTSTLSVTQLAARIGDPQRFVGLHVVAPALGAELVEIVRAEQTAQETVEALAAFLAGVGRQHVVVKDRPGFLLNRLLMPYLNQVVRTYDAGLATSEDIDTAVRLGLGYRRGPLELLEAMGIGSYRRTANAVYEATKDVLMAPPPLLDRWTEAGPDGAGRAFGLGSE